MNSRSRLIQLAWLVRVGEKTHRRRGADEDDVVHVFEQVDGLIDRVGDAFHRYPTRAARDSGRQRLRIKTRTGRG